MTIRNVAVVIGLTTVAIVVGFAVWETFYLNGLIASVIESGLWIPLLIVAGVSTLGYLADSRESAGWRRAAGLLGIAGASLGIFMIVAGPYLQNQSYLTRVTTTTDAAPTFAERAALPVARNQVATSMATVGETQQSAYVPSQDRFTTLVSSRDWFGGYTEVVNQKVALTGQSSHDNCSFTEKATKRLDGRLFGSLSRWIAQSAGYGTIWDEADGYGYCDNDAPMVVQPLLELRGVWPVVRVPSGVALYNGKTGALQILRGEAAGNVPGPAVGESWARRLWQATSAEGSWWDHQMGVVGFSDTSRDTSDPNAENRSEFVLNSAGKTSFVSPLTRKGASSGIAALSVVPATFTSQPASMTIHVFGEGQQRQSNSAAVDRIKAAFGDLSWASGLQVFEIAPVSAKEWVASIGLKQNVTYRVRMAADGAACLESAAGARIRCVSADQTATTTPTETVPIDADLSKLSDAQLADLVERINAEVQNRLRER